jgi:hypothetical protein
MAYLVPFDLALKPGEEVRYRSYTLRDLPQIPDDTYQLQEWYCPNPQCPCQEALLKVLALTSRTFVATFRVSLDPTLSFDPVLDPADDPAPYALALGQQIAKDFKADPAYAFRLRSHYYLVKAVAADPAHPGYAEMIRWAKSGFPKSAKRKRHSS